MQIPHSPVNLTIDTPSLWDNVCPGVPTDQLATWRALEIACILVLHLLTEISRMKNKSHEK